MAQAASPASPGAGLIFHIWQVLSGFSKLNKRKTGQTSKMQGKFQSRSGLRKPAGATPHRSNWKEVLKENDTPQNQQFPQV